MKVVVNRGRTVLIAIAPGLAPRDDKPGVRPVTKAYGPTSLIDLPDDEAKRLIRLDVVTQYVPPKAREISTPDAA